MFDSLKSMAGLAGLMKDLPRLKEQMEAVKQRLAGMTAEAETGGGAVRVTANGLLSIVSVEVDQALLVGLIDAADPADRAMAQDLIAGAANAALARARQLAEQEFASAAAEMGLPIPPGAMEGLMGA